MCLVETAANKLNVRKTQIGFIKIWNFCVHVFVIAEHKIKTKQKIKNKRRGFVKTIKQMLLGL